MKSHLLACALCAMGLMITAPVSAASHKHHPQSVKKLGSADHRSRDEPGLPTMFVMALLAIGAVVAADRQSGQDLPAFVEG